MAFSYSDKNFTVIGNLCFVHIVLDGTTKNYNVPPAISDRMLVNNIIYPYAAYDEEIDNADIGLASVNNTNIIFYSTHNKGYFLCFFPIDSNK